MPVAQESDEREFNDIALTDDDTFDICDDARGEVAEILIGRVDLAVRPRLYFLNRSGSPL
jgi:hypothetical protein